MVKGCLDHVNGLMTRLDHSYGRIHVLDHWNGLAERLDHSEWSNLFARPFQAKLWMWLDQT
jgi:hypothetical protein